MILFVIYLNITLGTNFHRLAISQYGAIGPFLLSDVELIDRRHFFLLRMRHDDKRNSGFFDHAFYAAAVVLVEALQVLVDRDELEAGRRLDLQHGYSKRDLSHELLALRGAYDGKLLVLRR